MKIGIITYHNGDNHGAVLQAYALCTYLNSVGHQAQVVRFTPIKKHKRRIDVYLKQLLVGVLMPTHYRHFVEKYIPHTKVYGKSYDLRRLNQEFDAFITGSDQVFNVKALDKKGYYFLSFAEQTKKISYAASFGEASVSKEKGQLIQQYLHQFDSLSVREKSGISIIRDVAGREASWTIDPTFLLTASDWNKIEEKTRYAGKYIFAYYNSKPGCNAMIQKLAKKYGLKVVVVSRTGNNLKSDYLKDFNCTPNQFLNYIKNAALICTDSFHGTAFAINYRKPFLTYVDSIKGESEADTRKVELLERLHLEGRQFTSNQMLTCDPLKIDYSEVNEYLEAWIAESKEFLECALK